MIEECNTIKKRWRGVVKFHEEKFQLENAGSKPSDSDDDLKNKFDRVAWNLHNYDLAKKTPEAIVLADEFAAQSFLVNEAVESMINGRVELESFGSHCPVCSVECKRIPGKTIVSNDGFYMICTSNESHIVFRIPLGG
jgi:hypothetical protein